MIVKKYFFNRAHQKLFRVFGGKETHCKSKENLELETWGFKLYLEDTLVIYGDDKGLFIEINAHLDHHNEILNALQGILKESL